MLTAETKRHIDAARQVLVGKVPDPKQQIDQITNALIYKFMDDMDVQSIDVGGSASFFTGDLEKYSWRKLMDPRKGAQERLNMYTEALEKFSTAAQLPQLFRDIFRQAFLPYRDPETLNLFLKEIEFFDYNHSEELGNAFEYLLSIMGSQGDAGQFRTPRHIIDFIVDIIDPDYDDTILDPACGTAGFLISAYKHIVGKHNGVDEDGKKNNEKQLTHEQKQKLMDNLEGYDISSDMVKLARVNMYLHDNRQPKIFEYDTLASEERWSDNFDVIIANPPFMSPKGGIRTHNKFSVETSRAEVLFVDYIVSHLKQTGRAGIIVPEGIIFQSGKSYIQLRKMLVEDGLLAVISLPAGVFNPYSGVKTSILIFDNTRAKQSKNIIFAKVNHDGFDLGAQRRPTPDKDDLPIIAELLRRYRGKPGADIQKLKTELANFNFFTIDVSTIGGPDKIGSSGEVEQLDVTAISRMQIAESGDYNLSASRYVETETNKNQKWPTSAIGDIVDIIAAKLKIKSSEVLDEGTIPVIDQSQKFIAGYTNRSDALIESKRVIAFGDHTRAVKYINFDFAQGADGIKILKPKANIIPKYLYYVMANLDIPNKGYSRHWTDAKRMKIPIPPTRVQNEIVAELDNYQKIIDGVRQVTENYKPTIQIDPTWPSTPLESVCIKITDGSHNPPKTEPGGGRYMLSSQNIFNGYITTKNAREISKKDFEREDKRTSIELNDVLLTIVGTIGRSAVVDKNLPFRITLQRSVAVLKPNTSKIHPNFLNYIIRSDQLQHELSSKAAGVAQKGIYLGQLAKIEIPLPPLKVQAEITATLEEELKGINATKELAKIYGKKIKDKIAEVWSE